MIITRDQVQDAITDMFSRCEVARAVGVSMKDHVEGAAIPAGWWYDPMTCFYLPPNFSFEGGRA